MRKILIFWILVIFVLSGSVSADSIYTNQINFAPSENRTHNQTISTINISNVTVTLDSDFILLDSDGTLVGENLSWTNVNVGNFSIESPSGCVEGKVYRMPVTINEVFYKYFTFICIPDEKIVDHKAEYGHGDSNYLDSNYRYLPNINTSIFNLIRVFTYGSYFNPNEDGVNATIQCEFPDFLVMTRQKNQGTNIYHDNNIVNATFYWENLFGNWFRVAPLEQELTGLNVGDTYNITCNDLVYKYSTGDIRAHFESISFEIRNTTPLNVIAIEDTSLTDKSITYHIQNIEKYPIYDVEFIWKTSENDVYYENIKEIEANETIAFQVFLTGNGNITLDSTFVPVWQYKSLKPIRYSQTYEDTFNFTIGDAHIDRILGNVNTSLIDDIYNNIITINNNINTTIGVVTLSDVERVIGSQEYSTELTIYDNQWNFVDDDLYPTILIKDPDGIIIANETMWKVEGVYKYTKTIVYGTVGLYTTEVHTTVGGQEYIVFDKWTMISNPTEVTINVTSICEKEVCAELRITNEGYEDYEYIYYWWTSDEEFGDYGDITTVDKGQASKLIKPSETFVRTVCLQKPKTDEPHYFRAKTYYGDYSFATDQYDNNKFECRGTFGETPMLITKIPDKALFNGGFILILITSIIGIMWIFIEEEEATLGAVEGLIETVDGGMLMSANTGGIL